MKKNNCLIFLILFCGISFSQTSLISQKKDSITYLLKNAKGKSQLRDLKKAVLFAKELQMDSLIMVSNVAYGLQSFFKKKPEGLDFAQENLSKLYARSKDSFALAKVHHYKALFHLLNFKKDSSLYHYVESKNISILLKDSLAVGRRLLSMANLQRDGKDFLGSEVSSIDGLRFLEPIKDYKYSGSLYNNLGLVALRTGKYKEARTYFNKSKKVHQKNPSKRRKEIAGLYFLNNVGNSYYKEGNYSQAIFYYKKGLQYEGLSKKYLNIYTLLLNNLSNVYIQNENYDLVLSGLIESNKILLKENNIRLLGSNHFIQAKYYTSTNNNNQFIFHAKKALSYAKKSKHTRREAEVLSLLSESNTTNAKEANNYLKRYIKINDSLLKIERTIKDQFAKIRYETGKKEKENATLKIENEKKQLEIKQEKQQKTIGFLIATGSLLILAISIVVFRNRRKKLAFEAQLQKAEAREKERKQIAKSLHDEVAGDIRVIHQQLEKNNQLEIAENLDKVKNTVRNLSHQLSSVSFEEVSFKDQIINLLSDYFSLTFKIKVEGMNDVTWSAIENPIKRTLFLSVRECIQNSVKHANATEMNIAFVEQKNSLQLCIADNGNGFDSSQKKKGIGLMNLKERIEELNGQLLTDSELEKGTKITIEIPLNA